MPDDYWFHRAFDYVSQPFEALEQIIDLGIHRILTSGQEAKALDGLVLIKQLIEKADGRIIILPGSGINSKNIEELAKKTNAKEFHLSAKKIIGSIGESREVQNLENEYYLTDREEVKKVAEALKRNGD